jgi:hypothetical protein
MSKTKEEKERYCITSDGDHKYVIPVKKLKKFEKLLHQDYEKFNDEFYEDRVDCVETMTFTDPEFPA